MHNANHTLSSPFIFTLFGASGDLAKLKIFPALYELVRQKRFPKDFHIVGYARTKMTRKQFQNIVKKSIREAFGRRVETKVIEQLLDHVDYFSGQYHLKDDFLRYRDFLDQKKKKGKNYAHVAYFSTPPTVFQPIIEQLAETRKSKKEDIRLVIEKPFGTDKASAEKLFHFVSQYFREEQVYLLDHYLGKAEVQSILNMRRSNRLLSNILQGSEIANIQITAHESVGVEERIGYFEHVGIIRDVIQSHLLQVLALVTMDIPLQDSAKSLQREKNNIIESIRCDKDPRNVVIGQYKSYRDHDRVSNRSRTETYAALRLSFDRQEWSGVPLYIRTGKKLKKKETYVVIELKKFPFQAAHEEPNRIIISFYPQPEIRINLVNYQEGIAQYQDIRSSASIACNIDGCLPAHGDLILDVLQKERMHFLSFAEILSSWELVDRVTKLMEKKAVKLHRYDDGGDGPKGVEGLVKWTLLR